MWTCISIREVKKRGEMEWLSVSRYLLPPSTALGLPHGYTSLPRTDSHVHQQSSNPGEPPPIARPSIHSFDTLYIEDAPTNAQRRRQKHRLKHFRIIVDSHRHPCESRMTPRNGSRLLTDPRSYLLLVRAWNA